MNKTNKKTNLVRLTSKIETLEETLWLINPGLELYHLNNILKDLQENEIETLVKLWDYNIDTKLYKYDSPFGYQLFTNFNLTNTVMYTSHQTKIYPNSMKFYLLMHYKACKQNVSNSKIENFSGNISFIIDLYESHYSTINDDIRDEINNFIFKCNTIEKGDIRDYKKMEFNRKLEKGEQE